MERPIDAPARVYLSTKQAARWLGLEPDHFEGLAGKEDWLRPVYFGRAKKWHWLDLVAYAHISLRRQSGPPTAGKRPVNQ